MGRDAGALIRSMIALRGERRTGVFKVDANGVRTSMFFLDGAVVYVEEAPSTEPLGRLLLRTGLMTMDQFTNVIQRMADALADDPEQLRFGALAVEEGLITDDQLSQSLIDQVRCRLIQTFRREDHEWRFKEGREGVDGVPLFDLALEPLVVLAVRSLPDELRKDLVAAASMGRFPLLADDASIIAKRFELKPGERAFIEQIDGSTRVSDLIPEGSPAPVRNHQSAILAALLWTRAAKLNDQPRNAPVVKVGANEQPPPSSRRMDATEAPPPSSRALPFAATAADSSGKLPAAAPAKDSLPKKITHESRLNAELAFQKGKTHLRSDRPDEALGEFRRACELDPGSPEYELYMRWAEGGAGEKEIDSASRLAIKRAALASNRNQPNLAFPLYVIGRLTSLDGQDADATKWFERALKMEPEMREAERAIRTIKGKSSKGADDADKAKEAGLMGRVAGWLGRDKP